MIIRINLSPKSEEYHQGLLLVKVKKNTAPLPAMRMAATGLLPADTAPGLSALDNLERAGMVKRVTPLVPEDEDQIATRGMLGALNILHEAATASVNGTHLNSGVSLVEVNRDTD